MIYLDIYILDILQYCIFYILYSIFDIRYSILCTIYINLHSTLYTWEVSESSLQEWTMEAPFFSFSMKEWAMRTPFLRSESE